MTKIIKGSPSPTSDPSSKTPATNDEKAAIEAPAPGLSPDSAQDLMEGTSSESSPPPTAPGAESPLGNALVEPSDARGQSKPVSDDEAEIEALLYDDTFLNENELLSIVPTSETPAPKKATSPPPEPRIAWSDTESDTFGVGALPDSSSDLEVQLSHSEVESDTLPDDGEGFNPAPVFEPPEREEPALVEDPESGAPAAESHPELPDFPAGRQPKWFQVGKIVMTGDDIKLTIKVVEQMETGLIACIDRRLNEADNPGGVPGPRGSRRVRVPVPAPGGGRRVITARTRKDSVPSVKDRFLSKQERSFFLKAAEDLPNVRHPVSGKSKQTDFKREVLRVLGQPNVELYELRTLLPIKESGSLAPISKSGNTKAPPRYQRVASTMLRKKARELGI